MPLDAKNLLQKFGWNEGKGLGANGQGRADAVFVRFRAADETKGVGTHEKWHAVSKGHDWAGVFEGAAGRLGVDAHDDGEGVAVKAAQKQISAEEARAVALVEVAAKAAAKSGVLLPTRAFKAGPTQRPEEVLGAEIAAKAAAAAAAAAGAGAGASGSSDSDAEEERPKFSAPMRGYTQIGSKSPILGAQTRAALDAAMQALPGGRSFMYENRCRGKLARLAKHDAGALGYDPALLAMFSAPKPKSVDPIADAVAAAAAITGAPLTRTGAGPAEGAAAAEADAKSKKKSKRKRDADAAAEAAPAAAAPAATAEADAAAEKAAKKQRKRERREAEAAAAAAAAAPTHASTPPPPELSAAEEPETAEQRAARKAAKRAAKASAKAAPAPAAVAAVAEAAAEETPEQRAARKAAKRAAKAATKAAAAPGAVDAEAEKAAAKAAKKQKKESKRAAAAAAAAATD